MVINYAHRGASGNYPENTMLSFEKAIQFGCDGIETDVQMTIDKKLVLIHDERVDRTTDNSGFVKDYTLKKLKKLSAGAWFNKKYSKERIPTAEELLILAKQNKIIINFEIKTGIIMYPGIEEKLINLIYKFNMQNNVILSSFNHASMVTCKQISKEIKTGLLFMQVTHENSIQCKLLGANAIHPYYLGVNANAVKEVKAADLLINTFTVDEEIQMKNLILAGVDGIITNYPKRLSDINK